MRRVDRDARIVQFYVAGRTLMDIAEQFGLTNRRISQIVRAAGVATRRRGRKGKSIDGRSNLI